MVSFIKASLFSSMQEKKGCTKAHWPNPALVSFQVYVASSLPRSGVYKLYDCSAHSRMSGHLTSS